MVAKISALPSPE